jgi:hypothetical protein
MFKFLEQCMRDSNLLTRLLILAATICLACSLHASRSASAEPPLRLGQWIDIGIAQKVPVARASLSSSFVIDLTEILHKRFGINFKETHISHLETKSSIDRGFIRTQVDVHLALSEKLKSALLTKSDGPLPDELVLSIRHQFKPSESNCFLENVAMFQRQPDRSSGAEAAKLEISQVINFKGQTYKIDIKAIAHPASEEKRNHILHFNIASTPVFIETGAVIKLFSESTSVFFVDLGEKGSAGTNCSLMSAYLKKFTSTTEGDSIWDLTSEFYSGLNDHLVENRSEWPKFKTTQPSKLEAFEGKRFVLGHMATYSKRYQQVIFFELQGAYIKGRWHVFGMEKFGWAHHEGTPLTRDMAERILSPYINNENSEEYGFWKTAELKSDVAIASAPGAVAATAVSSSSSSYAAAPAAPAAASEERKH